MAYLEGRGGLLVFDYWSDQILLRTFSVVSFNEDTTCILSFHDYPNILWASGPSPAPQKKIEQD
jgi:hypothetical protein